MMMKVMMLNVL